MEARFERDELQRELKRVQRDIQALLDEENEYLQENVEGIGGGNKLEGGEILLNELLKSSEYELEESAKTRWDLPLPVPAELETEERLDELLQISEEALGGLKLHLVRRTSATSSSWELTGSAGPVEFKVEFQTKIEGERTIIRNFELKKIPHECVQEVNPLMELARSRSCVRTWLVGMSEYAFLIQEREVAFAEIRSLSPHGSVKPQERRVQNYLDAVSNDGQRSIRLVWRAEWTVLSDHTEPNEFLLPRCEVLAFKGFEKESKVTVEDPDAFSGLARKHGIPGAMVILIKKMQE